MAFIVSGLGRLPAAHGAVAAHHGDNDLPLLEWFCKSYRAVGFTLVDALERRAASAELDAVEFIRANRDP